MTYSLKTGVKVINTDSLALEAIGVFAFLFGHQNHKFILIIDEFEKIFLNTGNNLPNDASVLSLKKLFEVIGTTRSLLVLSGLPDFYEFLPRDARERITLKIEPSPLNGKNVIEYIKRANKKLLGKEILKPFSKATAEYISIVSSGNARRAIRICYLAFQDSILEKKSVTRQGIKEILQKQIQEPQRTDISSVILQVIKEKGWYWEKNKRLSRNLKIDYWLPFDSGNSGIAIIVAQNVFSKDDYKNIANIAHLLRKENIKQTEVLSLLVIEGYIPQNLNKGFIEIFDGVLKYNAKEFKGDLESILTRFKFNFEEKRRETENQTISNKLNQLFIQYSSLNEAINQEMMVKKDLLLLVQNKYNTSFDKKGIILSSSKSCISNLSLIISLLNNIENTIKSPFFNIMTLRDTMSGGVLLMILASNVEVLTSLYFTKELVSFFLDFLAYPQKYDKLSRFYVDENIELTIKVIAEVLIPKINALLKDIEKFPRIINDVGLKDIIDKNQFYSVMKEFSTRLSKLPDDILKAYYANDKIYLSSVIESGNYNELTCSFDKIITESSQLNDIFISCSSNLIKLDRSFKESLLALIFSSQKPNSYKSLDLYLEPLAYFFYYENVLFLFMNVISYSIASKNTYITESGFSLQEFCYRFGRNILIDYDERILNKLIDIRLPGESTKEMRQRIDGGDLNTSNRHCVSSTLFFEFPETLIRKIKKKPYLETLYLPIMRMYLYSVQ